METRFGPWTRPLLLGIVRTTGVFQTAGASGPVVPVGPSHIRQPRIAKW
ncbi:MAG: hypothetical protein RLY31_1969 [Bacteroidota bacterium]|jgi:hypothetical protein